jgi:tRNA uracil 4-sulfurtransferase
LTLICVRPAAELATKGPRVKAKFRRALEANVAEALARRGIAHELSGHGDRVFVSTDAPEAAYAVLARVFGVASFSPVLATVASELDAIVRAGVAAFAEVVRGKRYAVRARRGGQHPFSSGDIARELGAALNAGAQVDLEDPEITVYVDVLGLRAHVYGERRPGQGGLPCAVQGRALTLLSGGFDSAVAAWRVMKRGVAVDFLLCNLGGNAYERMVLQVAKVLTEGWAQAQRPTLHVVDFHELVSDLRAKVRPGYWQLALKRLMYGAAGAVAAELDVQAIVTGESIGQVSSQTIFNLAALDDAFGVPILRPLCACDKQEIIAEARKIGTASISEKVKEYCALGGARPVADATRRALELETRKLDRDLLPRAVAERRVIDVLSASADDLRLPYLWVPAVPDGAVVLDCRPRHQFDAWHPSGAVHHEPADLLDGFRHLDKDRTYVICCEHGTQAAVLSELMQQSGYEAYALAGGLGALRRSSRPTGTRREPTRSQ